MSIFDIFKRPTSQTRIQTMTTYSSNYISWNGKLYDSDLVRACIRPTVQAAGKMQPKHIRTTRSGGIEVDAVPWVRILLKHPNPYMTGQLMIEKLTTQLLLNSNAFALIIRNNSNIVEQIYPITKISTVEEVTDSDGTTYLTFMFQNGKKLSFNYEDILHLRRDFYSQEILGDSPASALSQLMDCVGTVDQGLVNAIKNSGIIKWLLKFNQPLRPEDLKRNTKEFVDNYLSFESETFGAAGVDTKVDVKQIEAKDLVPNAAVSDRLTDRIYSFFNISKKIVQSTYTEDEWNAFYESVIEPIAIQLSEVMTNTLFSIRDQDAGNRIIYESSNLMYASMSTKLNFVSFVDRGIMCANEVRALLNLAPIEGGDQYVRRLDTAPISQ